MNAWIGSFTVPASRRRDVLAGLVGMTKAEEAKNTKEIWGPMEVEICM